MVAESTEIFAPMRQLGCATACSGVTSRIASRARSRNGPPLAVRTIRSIALACSKSKTWKIALCSLSTGSSRAPRRFASAVTSAPAQTRTSLLASATMAPRPTAATGGADDGRHHPIGRTRRRFDHRRRTGADFDAGAGERILERAVVTVVSDHGELGVEAPRLLGEAR